MASTVGPLQYLYHSAYSKYLKYKTRFERSVQTGKFARFSGRKKAQLTHRLRKLRDRVLDLHCRLKFGIAGGALALALTLAQPAEAQSTLGPFQTQLRSVNPLRAPIERLDDDITVAADFDNDGDLDLIIGHYDGFRLFINNGTVAKMLLDPATPEEDPFDDIVISIYENNFAPAFADLDEDGDLDLFVGTDYGIVRYFQNDDGAFTEISNLEPWVHTAGVPGATGNPLSGSGLLPFTSDAIPAFVDYDDDGDLDLLIGHDVESDPSDALYGAVDIVENTDNESFLLVPIESNPFYDFWWTDIGNRSVPRMVDVDNDGDLDLLTAHDGGEGLPGVILCRNNDGTFEVELNYDTFGGGYYSAIEFADFDDDGDQDAIVTGQAPFNPQDQYFLYYVNDGLFNFTEKVGLQNPFGGIPDFVPGHISSIINPAFIDIDNDGDLDAFVGSTQLINPNYGPGKIVFYRYDHITQEFSEEFIGSPGSLGTEFQSIPVTVDIDGDADLDLFISGVYGQLDLFLNNDADEGFTEVEPSNTLRDAFNTSGVTIMPAFIDMDGDGDLDAFIAQSQKYSQASIRFFENTGDQFAAAFTEVVGTDNPFDGMGFVSFGGIAPRSISISVGDINNDERPDILIGDALGQVHFFQQDEDDFDPNTFNSFTELTGTDNPFTNPSLSQNPNSQLIDFDNDGDKDIFTGNSYGGITHQINTNPAPVITSIAGDVIFPNSAPVVLDPNLTLADSDNDLIQKATITLDPYEPGIEQLSLPTIPPGFTSQFADGILEIAGPMTVADFQAILRTVTYEYNEGGGFERQKGSAAARTISKTATFVVFDQDGTTPSSTLVLNLTHSNDIPTISPASLNASYIGTPLVLNSGIVLADDDDPTLVSAEVAITTGFQSAEDELLFTPVSGLSATFNPTSGVLRVTGTGPIADYTTFLQSVQYRNLNATPTGSNRVIQFTISDIEDPSNPAVVNLSLPSTAPSISSGVTTLLYSAPSVIIDNSFTITDPDNSTLASATIIFNAGFVSAEDRLLFTNTASITGSFSTATGILTLTGTAPIAEYESALESISYQNLSPTPNKQNRIVSFVVSDGPNSSNAHTISVTFPNLSPTLNPSTSSATYTGGNLVLNSTLAIVDDDANMGSANTAITGGFVSGEDELVFVNQNGITGSFSAATGVLTLTGATTLANYQTALRSVEYRNVAANRTNNNRTIDFIVNDGVAASNISSITLAVPNSSPTLGSTAGAKNYTSGNLIVDNSILITDTDDTSLTSAQVTISGGFVNGEDELLFTSQNGITGVFSPSTGILTLSGNATLADYQTAVRSVEYRNIGAAHTPGVRTISFSVNDGVAASAVINVSINVINQAPTITGTANGFYTTGDLIINGSIVVADADNANLQSATASISSGFQSGEDVLVFSSQNGITGNYNASTGVLLLSGSASIGNYQAALRSVQYRNTSSSPNTGDRTITFSVNDGTNTSSPATTLIVINKPPAIAAAPQVTQAGGNIVFLVADILSDPDNNLDLTTLTIVSAQGANIIISGGIITIDYSNVPDYEGTDELTITICDQGGKCRTENVSIEVGADVEVFNGISANGDGVNDYFRIRFLPAGAKVSIYNRWGDSVFEMEGYDNNDSAKRFEGFNNSGNELTSGTYFYKVSLPDGKEHTGYLLLKR